MKLNYTKEQVEKWRDESLGNKRFVMQDWLAMYEVLERIIKHGMRIHDVRCVPNITCYCDGRLLQDKIRALLGGEE